MATGGEIEGVLSECPRCGTVREGLVLACPKCGWPPLVRYRARSFAVERDRPGIWRYSPLLPRFDRLVSRGEGLTPLNRIGEVLVKNERYNPTGSYSDRASSVIASYVAARGLTRVRTRYEEDFTRSLAFYLSGLADLEVLVDDVMYLDHLDAAELVEAGAELLAAPSQGSAAVEVDYFNPLTVEGLKTVVFEVLERKVKAERIVVPARMGVLALSAWKGVRDLEEAGLGQPFEVVAATIKGSGRLEVADVVRGVKVVEIGREEVLEALVSLERRGVVVKPLSALAFAVAENLGSSVAVMTAGVRYPSSRRARGAELRRKILKVLEELGPSTAYAVWKRLPGYTLRGIYKALASMERRGEVCAEVGSLGARRIRRYGLC